MKTKIFPDQISLFFLSLIFCFPFFVEAQTYYLQSPNKKISFQLIYSALVDQEQLQYSVNYNDKNIVLPSRLGIETQFAAVGPAFENGTNWSKDLKFKEVVYTEKDTLWKPVYGERSSIRDNYKAMMISFIRNNNPKQEIQLHVRVYNEGVAFRYYFAEHPDGGSDLGVRKEFTEFTMPEGTQAWFTKMAQNEYKLLPLKGWNSECERPLVLQLSNGLYTCLSEAQVVEYARTKFILREDKPNTIATSMHDRVYLTTPFATPWRVVMVAEKPGQLLENNDLILNLNPPCQIKNTTWIKPGKVMRETTLSTKGAKEVIDFNVKHNMQYMLFDAGWYGYEYVVASDATKVTVDPRRNKKNELDMPEVIRYANEKGIGVILYVNQRALFSQLDELLPLFQKWGVKGIKFGFVHVGSQHWTTEMHRAVKKCADYGLMVDIHDEYRPIGFSRTYPNLMTQEGILGNEGFPDATHNTTLPFTRYIAGAADYTLCYFSRDFNQTAQKNENGLPKGRYLKTTSAHQLAFAAVYYSPLQHMYWYDRPSACQDEPELAFWDAIPTVWDDTKVLQGEIGKFASIARRSGTDWFVGTITNNDAREIELSFSFLEKGKKYEATIYSDDDAVTTRTHVGITKMKVDAKSKVKVTLKASGGQAIMIKPLAVK